MNKDTAIQELKDQGKDTVRKQKLALTKWINELNYVIDHLDSQKDQGSVPIHLGIEYSPKAIRELRNELEVYQDLKKELNPAKVVKPRLANEMFVIAPCSNFNSGIIKGERYKVSGVKLYSNGSYSFHILDAKHFCLSEGCAHLGGKNWKVEKAVTRQMKRKK